MENVIDDYLAEAKATQHIAYHAAEHDRFQSAQTYSAIALAQAAIALVERLDSLIVEIWASDEVEVHPVPVNAIRTVEIK